MYINKQSNIQKKDLVSTKTASGNPVVITDCAGGKARSLKTTIEAIQDLHGYDKPWAGGSGKNKLPMTVAGIKAANGSWSWSGNTGTYKGGTATILTDGDNNVVGIKVNGTFSGPSNLRLTATGNLGLNGCLLSGTVGNAKVQAFDDTTLENIGDTGSGIIIPNNFVNYRAYIGFIATTYNDVIVYPQCEIGSTRTAFEPYSNLCPISGRTAVAVDDTGLNLFGIDTSRIGKDYDDGNTPERFFQTFALPKGTYIWKMNGSASGIAEVSCGVADAPIPFANINAHTSRGALTAQSPTRVITITDEYPYAFIGVRKSSGTITLGEIEAVKLQLEVGETAHDYTPYVTPTNATIQLGTTVYGADIDWDMGVGIVDKVLTVVNNNSAISAIGSGGFPFYVDCLTGAKVSTASALSGVLSNYLTEVTQSSTWGTPFTFSRFTFNNDRVFFKLSNDITTVDAAKTYLASNPIQFCYELATPITIQLTPTQLELLKGYNRVTIDNGSIELGYIPDNLAGDIISLVEEDYVKLEDVNTDPISVSGNPIVIQDAAAIKARSLKTTINAIQDLHGLPFPYVGGAYKNKLAYPYYDTTKTVSGITCTVHSDGIVTLTGTSTERVDFTLFQGVVPSEWSGMKFSGNPLAADVGIMLIQQRGGEWTNYCNSVYSDHEETINTIPVGTTVWVFIRIFSGKTVNATIKPMISTEGGTFAPWENKCPISGRTAAVLTRSDGDEISEDFTIQLGTTVYGAKIDWDMGVMSINKVIKDLGSLNWAYNSESGHERMLSDVISDAKKVSSSVAANITSSCFKADSYDHVYLHTSNGIISLNAVGSVGIYLDSMGTDASAFETAMAGQTICYELATPQTIQLTPTQLEMLKGYNSITLSDGYGTIELSYQKDNISGDIASLVENELSVKADNSDISNNFELGSTASKAYSTNQFMLREDGLYKVTSNIASGAEITSSNTTKVTITEVLTALLNA